MSMEGRSCFVKHGMQAYNLRAIIRARKPSGNATQSNPCIAAPHA